jgi:RES domain-containing protein
MIPLWRLEKQESRVQEAFMGKGSSESGGRWNPKGSPVIYTSQNLSLASLEVLVNIPYLTLVTDRSQIIENQLTREIIYIALDEEKFRVEQVDKRMLPNGWRSINHINQPIDANTGKVILTPLQRIGKNWLEVQSTPILKVPSAIIPQEFNYIINPKHPDVDSLFKVSSENIPLNPEIHPGDIELKHQGKLIFDDRLLVTRKI